MKSAISFLLAGALGLGSLACRSNPGTEGVECICGQPIANMHGCPHPACASGEANSDKPECVCGTLSLER
jgi:hypothetical protein